MEKPREILIHQSANRPHLLLGGDRELVLFAALMSAMLMFALVTWWGIAAGIALWTSAIAVLSRMGRSDQRRLGGGGNESGLHLHPDP